MASRGTSRAEEKITSFYISPVMRKPKADDTISGTKMIGRTPYSFGVGCGSIKMIEVLPKVLLAKIGHFYFARL